MRIDGNLLVADRNDDHEYAAQRLIDVLDAGPAAPALTTSTLGGVPAWTISGWVVRLLTEANLDPSTQIPPSLISGGVAPATFDLCATVDPRTNWARAAYPSAGRAIAMLPLAAATITAVDFDVGTLPANADTLQVLVYATNGSSGPAKRPSSSPVAWSKVKSVNGAGGNQQTWVTAANTISLDGTGSPASVAVKPTTHYLVIACSSTTPTIGRNAPVSGDLTAGVAAYMDSFTFSDTAPPTWVTNGFPNYLPVLVAHP